MKLKLSAEKKTEYLNRVKDTIKNPYYSIFVILGTPFIFALMWVLYDNSTDYLILRMIFIPILSLLFMLAIIIGPVVALVLYAYYTGNKLSSALLGFLLFSLMFFCAENIGAILNSRPEQLERIFGWSFLFETINLFLPFSVIHALIGFLTAFRKQPYLTISLVLFIVQIVVLLLYID